MKAGQRQEAVLGKCETDVRFMIETESDPLTCPVSQFGCLRSLIFRTRHLTLTTPNLSGLSHTVLLPLSPKLPPGPGDRAEVGEDQVVPHVPGSYRERRGLCSDDVQAVPSCLLLVLHGLP